MVLKRFIDLITLGSDRPLRRLAAYYGVIGVIVALLVYFVPGVGSMLTGEPLDQLAKTPSLLQDGLGSGQELGSRSVLPIARVSRGALPSPCSALSC